MQGSFRSGRVMCSVVILFSIAVIFLSTTTWAQFSGDFDQDGVLNCTDADALTSAIASKSANLLFDLNGDGAVGTPDLDEWLVQFTQSTGLPGIYGDINLDGFVGGEDLVAWLNAKFTTGTAWCSGDVTADGQTDFVDLFVVDHSTTTYPVNPVASDEATFTYDYLSGELWVDPGNSSVSLVVLPSPMPTNSVVFFEGTTQFYTAEVPPFTEPFALAEYIPGLDGSQFGPALWANFDFFTADVDVRFPADANRDGVTDGADFIIWNEYKFQSGTDFAMGDFNGDGITDGRDFIVWNEFKFTDWSGGSVVPEPAAGCLLVGLLATGGWCRLRRVCS